MTLLIRVLLYAVCVFLVMIVYYFLELLPDEEPREHAARLS